MERYKEYKDSGIKWLELLPVDWETGKLKYLSKFRSGDGIKGELIESIGPFPIYGGNGLRGYADNYTNDGEHILIGRQGALCGNVRLVSGKFWATEHAVVVYHNENVEVHWYKYLLKTMNLNQYAESAAQPGLSVEQISNLGAFLPPYKTQKCIATYLNRKTAQIDRLIADKENLISLLKEKRQAIISEAATKGLDPAVPMKDSGIEWIGEIPAHWEIVPLFSIAQENRERNAGNWNDNLLSLSYGRIINKDINTNSGLLPESFEGYQIVHSGYIILRLTDLQNDKRSLRTGLVEQCGIITSAYTGIIPSNRIDSRFLADLLHAYDLMKIFYNLGNGVRQSMNYNDLRRLPIALPPLNEQRCISEQLKNSTDLLDNNIALAFQQLDLLKEYRQAIINEAVTGKVKITEEGAS